MLYHNRECKKGRREHYLNFEYRIKAILRIREWYKKNRTYAIEESCRWGREHRDQRNAIKRASRRRTWFQLCATMITQCPKCKAKSLNLKEDGVLVCDNCWHHIELPVDTQHLHKQLDKKVLLWLYQQRINSPERAITKSEFLIKMQKIFDGGGTLRGREPTYYYYKSKGWIASCIGSGKRARRAIVWLLLDSVESIEQATLYRKGYL